MQIRRSTLVRCLLAHDEDDLVERVPSVTDEELKRIGELANHYAFSGEHAAPSGGSMGTSRAVSLAAVDVMEGISRELHRATSEGRDLLAEEDALRRLNIDHVPVSASTRRNLQGRDG